MPRREQVAVAHDEGGLAHLVPQFPHAPNRVPVGLALRHLRGDAPVDGQQRQAELEQEAGPLLGLHLLDSQPRLHRDRLVAGRLLRRQDQLLGERRAVDQARALAPANHLLGGAPHVDVDAVEPPLEQQGNRLQVGFGVVSPDLGDQKGPGGLS